MNIEVVVPIGKFKIGFFYQKPLKIFSIFLCITARPSPLCACYFLDQLSNSNLGFCFCTYTGKDAATQAAAALNGKEWKSRKLG